ncbi:MAG: hypothetical protein ACRD2W_14325 [Acidimicrobiales bacterium]
MNRQRNVALAVIGVLVVAGFLVGQLTGDDGAGDRLLASGPSTTVRPPAARGGVTTTVAGAPTSQGQGQGQGVGSSTPGSTAAGDAGPTTTGAGSTTAPAGTPGVTSGAGASGRTSGVSGGGGVSGGLIEEGASTETVPSGRGGDSSTTTTTSPVPPNPGPLNHSLSQDDDGKTIAVKVSDLIVLRLDPVPGVYWSDPVSDAPAVTREAISTLEGVILASFTATSAGTASLTAMSAQTCTTASPQCIATPQKSVKVTITVTA